MIEDSPWYVMLTQPQQAIKTVDRLHQHGQAVRGEAFELFVPLIRKRVVTGRVGRNGHKLTRTIAKPMFEGYGFLQDTGGLNHDLIEKTCRIKFWQDRATGRFVRLPNAAVWAIFGKQMEEQQGWLQEQRRGLGINKWKPGDKVRIDEDGGAWAGLVGTIEWANNKGNIGVLLGMIKHTLRADMVVAI